MERKAILIESSQIQGQPDLPGARLDVANWKAFLLSDEGGAWDEPEIKILAKPTRTELQACLANGATKDYVFIAFSGHGFHIKGREIDETMICLNEKDDIAVSALNPGNPRCTIIIDACRQIVTTEPIVKAFTAEEMIRSAEYRAREIYRKIFNEAVAKAERGIIRLYSCDIDEAAGESKTSGGYYTTTLLRCCSDWHDSDGMGQHYYYTTWAAHSCAQPRTTQRNPQQHPQYDGGRRNIHFPLAVKY